MLVLSGTNLEEDAIKQGIRQIKRWIYASKQDKNPGIALLHANYSVGNIDMFLQMYHPTVIMKYTKDDIFELYREATTLQDDAQKRVLELCPKAGTHEIF